MPYSTLSRFRSDRAIAVDSPTMIESEETAQLEQFDFQFPAVAFQFVARADWPSEEEAIVSLCPAESAFVETLRHPERRRQWLAGRCIAKRLAIESGSVPRVNLARLEMVSRDHDGKGIPPILRLEGRQLPGRLSLSHARAGILVAWTLDRTASVGVDLTEFADCRPDSLRSWFTERELSTFDPKSPVDASTQWAVKEAVYKAACRDEPFAPRQIEAVRNGEEWLCSFFDKPLDFCCRVQVRQTQTLAAAVAVIR